MVPGIGTRLVTRKARALLAVMPLWPPLSALMGAGELCPVPWFPYLPSAITDLLCSAHPPLSAVSARTSYSADHWGIGEGATYMK